MVAHGSEAAAAHERAHPSPLRYTVIALILAVITIIEVAIVYMEGLRSVLIPVLVVLSAAKFTIVAMFYMHLRFDSRLFSTFLVSGLLLAAAMIIVLLVLFGT
jgi:cytochrome c oxidase subunit 4